MTGDDDILREAALPLRISCLEEAARLTGGDRNKTYGEPVENMAHIARIFNAITGHSLTARDVAVLHVATKVARLRTSPAHRDSHVDAMAYAGIVYECAVAEALHGTATD